jgi:hypothetical protein
MHGVNSFKVTEGYCLLRDVMWYVTGLLFIVTILGTFKYHIFDIIW